VDVAVKTAVAVLTAVAVGVAVKGMAWVEVTVGVDEAGFTLVDRGVTVAVAV
jgi:hypothetical protein